MQVARSGLGVAVVNGKIYAIGGTTENEFVNTNEEYNPETDMWILKAPMPTPRNYFATAVYQNKIYCIGGTIGNSQTGDILTTVNEVYDPATDTWENKTDMPTARVLGPASVVAGNIYFIGGLPNGTLNECYNPATDTWTTMASKPIEASGPSVVFDNKIYVIGGFYEGGTFHFKTVTQIYDPETDEWSLAKPPNTFVVYGFAAATSGVMAPKRIYVFGIPYYGETAGTSGVPLCTNQVYDPEKDSWVTGADIPTGRLSFGVAVVNDLLYVIGGFTVTFDMFWNSDVTLYATNEQYTPFGYGTPDPSYDGIAPEITLASPVNKTYYTADTGLNFTDVTLNFTVDEPVFSASYRLDGGFPVEVSGNTTIAGLAVGVHNVSVFGFDASGNMGTSETVYFTIEKPEPFPFVPVAAASSIVIIIAGTGFMLYFKKRKH